MAPYDALGHLIAEQTRLRKRTHPQNAELPTRRYAPQGRGAASAMLQRLFSPQIQQLRIYELAYFCSVLDSYLSIK